MADWTFSKIGHQIWLRQDTRRFDFTGYHTSEELREVLLVRLPIGTSEEEVRAFITANGEFYQEPSVDSLGKFGTVMHQVKGNATPLRIVTSIVSFNGYWIVLFDYDPDNRTLIDIRVISSAGP